MTSLLQTTSLVHLNLSSTKEGRYRNRLQAKGIPSIVNLLSRSPTLQILNLSGTMLKSEGARVLCAGLVKIEHKTLLSLDISDNEITHTAAQSIHDLLIDSHLLRLDLSHNKIGLSGLEKLNPALYFSRCKLNYLNLAECSLTYQGFVKIMDAVKFNYQIQTLVVDGNRAGPGGSFSLVQAMMA